jgi:hypothetical protein
LATTIDCLGTHRAAEIVRRLEHETEERVRHFAKTPAEIDSRLRKRNEEWDIERLLKTILRRLGYRTAREVAIERVALRYLRGDFETHQSGNADNASRSAKRLDAHDHSTGPEGRSFPTGSEIFFGLGLGGIFDGTVLHQVLQWHHMLRSWFPIKDVPILELNTLWDGILHGGTCVFVVIGLFLLW